MILRVRKIGIFVVFALAVTLSLKGQIQSQDQRTENDTTQPPDFRAEINYVRVDAIVTDGEGNPITDLESDDFEVLEDDIPQTIESFRLVRISGRQEPGAEPARAIRSDFDEEREAGREDVRVFAVFFDDYHVRLENARRLREPLINFLQTQLAPTDLVSIMYPLTPLDAVRMTRNHGAIVEEVKRFNGRKYDYEPLNDFERRYSYYPTSIVERIRNQVSLSALKALIMHLGGLREGRKALLLLSEGYTHYLPPQLRNRDAEQGSFGNRSRLDAFAGDNELERSLQFMATADMMESLQQVFDVANRNNTAIYAVDPRGLGVFEFDISQPTVSFRTDAQTLQSTLSTLRTLADQTDGRAIVSQNDFSNGLRQMVRDSSTYYLIGYNSTQAPTDGKFHEIKVRVRRSGLKVRARKGYWAFSPEDVIRATTPLTKPGPPSAVKAALAAIVEPRRGRFVRTWVGTARAENGKTRVTFVWEAIPQVSGGRHEELDRVSVTATNDVGDPYFHGRIPRMDRSGVQENSKLSNESNGTNARSGQAVFDAEPGAMHMVVAVEGTAGEVLDKEIQEVNIPDLTGVDVALSTPAIIRARNVLEERILTKDFEAMPTPGRVFRRTDTLLIRFEAYVGEFSVPTITVNLLSRSGVIMTEIPMLSEGVRQPHQLALSLATLAPGEYLVEISAAAGDSVTKKLVAFRVVS